MKFAMDRAPSPRRDATGVLMGWDRLAMDRRSQRSMDDEGRMRVVHCPISKATVNPYWGEEIPGWEELGLDPARTYMMLRPPEELEKAASSFNGVQLLDVHEPVSAGDPKREIVSGCVGSDTYFDGEYLRATVTVWTAEALEGIEDETKRELSSCYQYTPVMVPGVFNGLPFDGRMVNLRGNHVALVERGRAGPDVHVSDAQPEGMDDMPQNRHARRAALAKAKRIRSALAADSALSDAALAEMILAKDAKDEDLNPDPNGMDEDQDDDTAEDAEQDDKAEDEDDDELDGAEDEGNCVTTTAKDGQRRPAPRRRPAPAMDAAAIRRDALRDFQAIETAKAAVEPHVGKVRVAMDSAASVYRLALDHAKVDHAGINDPKALAAMVGMLPKPSPANNASLFAADSDEASPLDGALSAAPRLVRS